MSTRTRFEKEAKGNSEMAYCDFLERTEMVITNVCAKLTTRLTSLRSFRLKTAPLWISLCYLLGIEVFSRDAIVELFNEFIIDHSFINQLLVLLKLFGNLFHVFPLFGQLLDAVWFVVQYSCYRFELFTNLWKNTHSLRSSSILTRQF